MTELRLYLQNDRIGEQFQRSTFRQGEKVRTAARGTAQEAANQVQTRGRADIRSASPAFSKSTRWAPGFKAKVTEGGGHLRISVTSTVPYFKVFTKTTIIRGRPLLAIPFSFAKDAQGVLARNFPGRLFRVDRAGKASLLMSAEDKQPKYFLKASVRIPKKFKTIEIIRDVAKKMGAIYRRQFRAASKG